MKQVKRARLLKRLAEEGKLKVFDGHTAIDVDGLTKEEVALLLGLEAMTLNLV